MRSYPPPKNPVSPALSVSMPLSLSAICEMEPVVPPFRFGAVEEHLYRSAHPTDVNLPFLKVARSLASLTHSLTLARHSLHHPLTRSLTHYHSLTPVPVRAPSTVTSRSYKTLNLRSILCLTKKVGFIIIYFGIRWQLRHRFGHFLTPFQPWTTPTRAHTHRAVRATACAC